MTRAIGRTLMLLGVSSALMAFDNVNVVPEIQADFAVTALGLLSGGLLVLQARRRR